MISLIEEKIFFLKSLKSYMICNNVVNYMPTKENLKKHYHYHYHYHLQMASFLQVCSLRLSFHHQLRDISKYSDPKQVKTNLFNSKISKYIEEQNTNIELTAKKDNKK